MDSETPSSFEIAAPQIVVVADAATPAAQANARGHLLEKFVARLFSSFGCSPPELKQLNVKSNGYEIDLSTEIILTKDRVIAECKAYSSSLPVQALSSFYGKLSTERLVGGKSVHGWFIAIPGLTSDGQNLADTIKAKDNAFHSLNATEIYKLAVQQKWISEIEVADTHLSDQGILITETGLYAIAKLLDPISRLPTAIYVRRSSQASKRDLELFGLSSFAGSLPVIDLASAGGTNLPAPKLESPTLVSVIGSTADFEYQFPAAPKFFVGRKRIIAELGDRLSKPVEKGSVVVLNAQSGWGKSSLALKIAAQAEDSCGSASVFDARTASGSQYVAASIQAAMAKAEANGIVTLPVNASFGSLKSAIATIQSATWHRPIRPLVIFYDQFENVFREERITQEFRDLALMVREAKAPLTIGFSWKTDLVALTENYPYRLRDEIRGVATVINIDPFGPQDVGVVLNRLAKQSSTKLSLELRERMREYSQGLPWLLKKLASHILVQLKAGTTQEALLEESLNIEGLFAQDLAQLQPAEVEALKLVAREAPVAVADLVERVDPTVIQTLVDQRLLVRVGEKLDTYWDTFREFLVTGKVAVEDTFILRQRPRSTTKVLAEVIAAGGERSSADVAAKLATSVNVVFNAARELRQLGILAPKPGMLILADSLRSSGLVESSLQARVAKSLRRHRVYNTVQELIDLSTSGKITIDELTDALPSAYPAVSAKRFTWAIYAVAFAHWLEYGGLITLVGLTISRASGAASKVRLLGLSTRKGRTKTFPQGRPGQIFPYLRQLLGLDAEVTQPKAAEFKILSDLTVLGVIDEAVKIRDVQAAHLLVDPVHGQARLLDLLLTIPGGLAAIKALREDPTSSPLAVGGLIRDAYGQFWADTTTKMAGSKFRAWASAAGVAIE